MDTRSGRKWLINAFLIFLPGIFLWVMAVMWVSSAADGRYGLLENLTSQLFADYSPDSFGQSMKSLKLAIFGDVFSDSVLSEEEREALEQSMKGLVPTATLLPGAFIPTQTPLPASTGDPLPTVTPSLTPTSTPKNTTDQTKTPTPEPTNYVPTATPGQQEIIPILDCVLDNADDSHTAFFSYKNHNSYVVNIPIGLENKITPGEMDQGQPTSFEPGRSPSYPDAPLQIVFVGDSITWHLDGNAATASSNSDHCGPIVPETEDDTKPPKISEGNPNPPPGELSVCSMTIAVSDLRVTDAPPSSGIAWVKLKYQVVGYTSYIYSEPMLLCSGGPTEDGGWDGCYQGSILVEIDPTWSAPESGPFIIELYAKAVDENGHDTCYSLGEYSMPASCGVSE